MVVCGVGEAGCADTGGLLSSRGEWPGTVVLGWLLSQNSALLFSPGEEAGSPQLGCTPGAQKEGMQSLGSFCVGKKPSGPIWANTDVWSGEALYKCQGIFFCSCLDIWQQPPPNSKPLMLKSA